MCPLSWLPPEAVRDVPVLEIDWDVVEGKSTLLKFYRGVGHDARQIGEARAADLGLPDSTAAAAGWEPEPFLPGWLHEKLRAGLSGRFYSTDNLWLSFRQHDGYLAMMPWEELLREPEFARVFRLPYFLREPEDFPPLRVAIAAPSHSAALQLLDQWGRLSYLPPSVPDIRLFLPALAHRPALAPPVDRPPPFSEIHYFPEPTAPREGTRRSPFRHPLLRWILDVLPDRPLDLVVLFGRPTILENQGVFFTAPFQGSAHAFASPADMALSAEELDLFLKSVGAGQSVLVTDEKPARDLFGLRMFHDLLSQRNAAAHFFQLGPPTGPVYPYPFPYPFYHAPPYFPRSRELAELLENYTCRRLIREARQPGREVPRWLMAAQRHMEQYAAHLLNVEAERDQLRPDEKVEPVPALLESLGQTATGILEGLKHLRRLCEDALFAGTEGFSTTS